MQNTEVRKTMQIKEVLWKAILNETEKIMKVDSAVVMYTDAKDLFFKNFDYYYSLVLDKFMKTNNQNLDRHKIAAIAICSILKSNILGIASGEKSRQIVNNIFLANEKLALNIALNIIETNLKNEIDDIPYDEVFNEFVFPKPLSCERDYDEVICRDLYYAKTYFELNPLSIANFLFLLEAFSFTAHNIEINKEKMEKLTKTRQLNHIIQDLELVNKGLDQFAIKMEAEKNQLEKKKTELEKEKNRLERNL